MPTSQSIPSNQFDYKKLRSEIFLRYGIELDETTLTVLYILQTEITAELRKMQQSLDRVTDKISASRSSLQVDFHHPRWQAFWFGMGKFGFAIIFAASLLFMSGFIYTSQKFDYEQTEKELGWYKTYYDNARADNPKDLKRFLKTHPKPKPDDE